jgi:hypothetical protein
MADSLLLAALALQNNPWRAAMHRSTSYTTVSATLTTFPFATIDYDPNSDLTTGASALYTCPADGFYDIDTGYTISGMSGVEELVIYIYQNGSVVHEKIVYASATSPDLTVSTSRRFLCSAGDTLQIKYYTSDALTCTVTPSTNWAQFAWVSPR